LPWDDVPVTPDQPFGSLLTLKQRGVYNIPNDVERIIQTLLAIDPSKRFPSGQAAVDELERLTKKHRATTQNNAKPMGTGEKRILDTTNASASFHAIGVQPNEVETILGPDLVRTPIARAHERAEQLCQPRVLADLLDRWSKDGFYHGIFRRSLLGRMARLHRVMSHNIYYYHLQVLYEERHDPKVIQVPDREAKDFPLEPEVDRWKVTLPSVQIFENETGKQEVIPGSVRVVKCSTCEGKGKITCPRCKGQRRIQVTRQLPPEMPQEQPYGAKSRSGQSASAQGSTATRSTSSGNTTRKIPASATTAPSYSAVMQGTAGSLSTPNVAPQPRTEKVLVPCPACSGVGGGHCGTCDGTGRMIEHKAFTWERSTRDLIANDDFPSIDEAWLSQQFEPERVYTERVYGKDQFNDLPFRKEWAEIPMVKGLIEQAQAEVHANRRIILSELAIAMIPVTDVTFDIGNGNYPGQQEPELYEISIYGFEKSIPNDWRLLNWERVIFLCVSGFLLVLVVIFGAFAFV
jgi:hypothetical protein